MTASSASDPIASIILVTWNAADDISKALDRVVSELAEITHEIVVVDNASSDETIQVVQAMHPDVRVFQQGRNSGFAAGVNRGLSECRGEWVLLLNPDAQLLEGSATARQWLEANPQYALVGAQLVDTEGHPLRSHYPLPNWWVWIRFYLFRQIANSKRTGDQRQPFAVEGVVGACLWLRRAAIDQIGEMDPRFWLYTEEIDWCRRFGEAGFRIGIDPRWRVLHEGGGSAKFLGIKSFVALQHSRVQYVEKYSGSAGKLLFNTLFYLGFAPAVLAAMLGRISGRFSGTEARERIRGYWAAMGHVSGVRRWEFP